MADNIFTQYGIKEVADVQFEALVADSARGVAIGDIVLYLDTLKVSTIETTAEQTEASGGKGNPPLIIWDFGKEITITLDDALFSMASMAVTMGATISTASVPVRYTQDVVLSTTAPTLKTVLNSRVNYINTTRGLRGTVPNAAGVVVATAVGEANDEIKLFYDVTAAGANATTITIGPNTFPGTYKIIGDTFVRDRNGVDTAYQFVINKAKVASESTLTMEAEGDPTVFTMSLRVLRDDSASAPEMMRFIKYTL